MKGAIFDVDGTILDSMGVWFDITDKFFLHHGIHLPYSEIELFQNMALNESIPLIKNKYLHNLTEQDISSELENMINTAYKLTIPAKPYVCEYIRSLHNSGIKIAVATSGYKNHCADAFKRLGIFDCIDAYAYSDETLCGKDKPDIYLLAAKRIDVLPSECMVYEDLLKGVISAKRAGFSVTAVSDASNMQDTKRLIQNSDRYITGWSELLSNI